MKKSRQNATHRSPLVMVVGIQHEVTNNESTIDNLGYVASVSDRGDG
jgi:hypothetical protein